MGYGKASRVVELMVAECNGEEEEYMSSNDTLFDGVRDGDDVCSRTDVTDQYSVEIPQNSPQPRTVWLRPRSGGPPIPYTESDRETFNAMYARPEWFTERRK